MFRREFKINFKSLCIWTGIILVFFAVVFAIYPSIMNNENNVQLNEMMQMFPEDVLKMFNMDIVGIESAFGWFQTEGYMFLTLIGGVYASILGATILVKEENDKTIEFLYSKPITRNQIVTAKIQCGVINLIIFTGIITIFNLMGFYASDDLQLKSFLLISLAPLLLYVMLFFISLFISTFLKKTRKAMTIGLGITFISFLMQLIGNMGENVEMIKRFSLFEFVSARYIITNEKTDMMYLLFGIGIILIMIVGTYFRYNKKELV